MARPGLTRHPKFKLLTRRLGTAYAARGVLELIWDSAYENGDDVIGSADLVEAVAEWDGESGSLVRALVECRWIDEDGGTYRVHDLWHHAPDYVQKRRKRESVRRERQHRVRSVCGQCPVNGYEVTVDQPGVALTRAPAPAPSTQKQSPSDSCAEPAPERRSPPSPDCPEFPTKGPVRTWQATADQVVRWRELFNGLDVRHELQKAHAWVLANPGRAKTARGMAGFVLNWLTRATDRPRGAQPSFAPLPAAPPKPPRVHTRRDLLSQEIRDAEAFKRTDRVAELRRRLAEAERNGTADEPVE